VDVYLIYNGIQTFPELGERSSASARKWVDCHQHTTPEACFDELRRRGFQIFTTHLSSDATQLYALDLTAPVALVFGNEHHGVSDDALRLADGNVLIPQVGMIQSLNISVACAVSLFEAFRQRNARGMYDAPQYSDTELAAKLTNWQLR
jgi:tRNA (guanosine-2'-O-)-methyltransferase